MTPEMGKQDSGNRDQSHHSATPWRIQVVVATMDWYAPPATTWHGHGEKEEQRMKKGSRGIETEAG
eukprot:CAMPEP_0174305678 /NCGR_PEP_ID=MMETSP0809-20121228/61551_1 /TAXON_ID=73025 ORGANISM="Eutreptiella gymnastica-like, Strain CCMP1594" /NCGR_SAMPLE_ID=MMETSP0809 /ASSEMBLY_ACC=CAM_ASM_000658 /LENGTH=65 /DNA_ID=CAMNT_0015412193 /DNA_START=496 /DNA_END=693 /DNA_ORIENTATION=-